MFIHNLFEAAPRRVVVTYPGRFQPFHTGHLDVFADLQRKFGRDNVWIMTSNKTDAVKSPFNFSDKLRFMHAAGIPNDRIIETDKVYALPEQFQPIIDQVVFITVVGAPDAKRLNPGATKKDGSPSYFQSLPGSAGEMQTADKHGYVVVEPERKKSITIGGRAYDVSHGTPTRQLWNTVRNNPEQRAEFVQQLYGRNDPELAHILDKIPHAATESVHEAVDIPPPENARKTQIAGTLPTYHKGKAHLDTHVPKGRTLDFGAGLGGGAAAIGADSYEPYPPQGFEPTYTKADSIPSNSYERITNFNVLNVVPQSIRDMIVKHIGRILAPGGVAVITTRGRDVMTARGTEGPEPMSRITTIGTYQKGFTRSELKDYVEHTLGQGFEVSPLKLGPAGVVVKKLAKNNMHEDAAGVGLVRAGSDPRYMTATMGDDNDVDSKTLGKMMKAYHLIGNKPAAAHQAPVKKNIAEAANPAQQAAIAIAKKKERGVAEVKQRLDPKCWTGKHKEGTKIKGGIRVNNCVPNEGIETNKSMTEGLSHKDPVERWIAVFKASKHPKFAGKSSADREKMARMAQYKAVQNKSKVTEDEQGYHVKNNIVYGKVLAHNGRTVLADYDTAEQLADRFNAHGIIKSMDGRRYIIKMSEAPPRVVGGTDVKESLREAVEELHRINAQPSIRARVFPK